MRNVFFNPKPPSHPKKKTLLDFGGQGDCGFRSLSAGMLDWIFTQPSSSKKHSLCAELINHHLVFYPKYEQLGRGLDSVNRLKVMLTKPDFVIDLAYTLRQVAVDELVQHADQYPRDIVSDQPSPQEMAKASTWIDETAIAALANRLNVPVRVSVVHAAKKLPLRLNYGPRSAPDDLVGVVDIQLARKHYQPLLNEPDLFAPAQRTHVSINEPVEVERQYPSEADIIAGTLEADKQILKTFDDHLNTLSNWVMTNHITQEQLIDCYIDSIDKSDYLKGRVAHVALEHGNERFFERAIDNVKSRRLDSTVPVIHESQFTNKILNELVHAIARAMTIGDLDPKQVYEQRERELMQIV